MTFDSCKQLELRMNRQCVNEFYPFLQEGVAISAQVGCTLADLLGEQFALDREYVAARITTIFMDNRPVDDINVAMVHDGAKIALSGAMPGLVGATMRSGGFYANDIPIAPSKLVAGDFFGNGETVNVSVTFKE